MTDIAFIQQVEALRAAGRHDDILGLIEGRYAAAESMAAPARTDYFITLFEWKMLVEVHAPAAEALARARDEQARRLLAGEYYVGPAAHAEDQYGRADRVGLLLDMNRTLGDPGASRAVFLQLEAQDPALARRQAYRFLEAIVQAGDFALAERYRGDPLEGLRAVNHAAAYLPLFPPGREAPRLAADLSNLAKDVWIAVEVLRGLGREAEAQAVRTGLLDGLASEELRAVAERELAAPGTIHRIHAERQTALDAAGG